MRHLVLGTALLLTVCTTAAVRADKEKPKPDKPSPAAAELRALEDEFSKAQNELYKPLQGIKSQEEAEKIIEKEKINETSTKLSAEFAKRGWALAEKHAADQEGTVDVLVWIVSTFHGVPEAAKAADLIVKEHITDKKVDSLLGRLSHSPSEVADKLLGAAADKIKAPERGYLARFHLAQYLKNKAESIAIIASMDDKTRSMVETRIGKEYLARLSALDPAKLNGEAEALLVALSKDPTDVKERGQSVKEQIENTLFELRFLSIGKVAPEIEGEDLDGKKFSLSEYRGKVVVLDFWGNW
jgi:hypothetical protein